MLGDCGRGAALSTASTVVVLAALAAIVLLAPGSGQVRHTFFNPTDMWQSFIGDPKAAMTRWARRCGRTSGCSSRPRR